MTSSITPHTSPRSAVSIGMGAAVTRSVRGPPFSVGHLDYIDWLRLLAVALLLPCHSAREIKYILEALGITVYFGGDTLLIPELCEIPARFPHIDVALLPVNGLEIRPAFNRKVVMDAQNAAELCAILQPWYAVPTHYAFTAGLLRDRLLPKYTGTAEEFAQAAAYYAHATSVHILTPDEPLVVRAAGARGDTPIAGV